MGPRLSSGGLAAGLTHRQVSRVAIAPRAAEGQGIVTQAEREVADLLPIEVDPALARATVEAVPFYLATASASSAESRTRSGCSTCCGGGRRAAAPCWVETYGVRPEDRDVPAIRVSEAGEVYARDEFVYWGFGHAGLERLARIAGFSRAESFVEVEVDDHPRIMGRLIA